MPAGSQAQTVAAAITTVPATIVEATKRVFHLGTVVLLAISAAAIWATGAVVRRMSLSRSLRMGER